MYRCLCVARIGRTVDTGLGTGFVLPGQRRPASERGLASTERLRAQEQVPTEGGSSGSPVFNADWKLIGLQHAASDAMPRLNGQPGTYAASEGIWIKAIAAAMNRSLA
jgi:hypothetical protein